VKIKGLFSDTHFLVDFLALNRPWPYLVALCSFFTMIFVFIGNPTLPIQALATYGWAWHHLPEILSFLFLGMWLGSLGYLSLESLTYHDSFALFLLGIVGIAYAEIISYILLFPIVLTIVFIPSFLGYFAIRLHNLQKSKTVYKHQIVNDLRFTSRPNCENVEFIDTPVAKGWFCVACFGGPTELNEKLKKFSEEHGSPEVLILKYTQTTLF
jgi:hypothetical protein